MPATTSTPAGTADAGTAGRWLWDVMIVLAAVATAGFVAVSAGPPVAVGVAAVLVLALGRGWLVVGRRLAAAQAAPGSRAVLVYSPLLVVAVIVAVVLVPEASGRCSPCSPSCSGWSGSRRRSGPRWC